MAIIYHSGLETRNTDLAAALTACGIPLDQRHPFKEFRSDTRGTFTVFYFEPSSRDGEIDVADLIGVWEDKDWHEKHPEHPFSYIRCAMRNRLRLLDFIKKSVPMALIEDGQKNAFIPLDASLKVQDLVLSKLSR